MNIKSDKIWMAYLDGELTPYEIITFENSLPSPTLKRLRKEFVFEDFLRNKLPGKNCPENLWKRIRSEIKAINRKNKPNLFSRGISRILTAKANQFRRNTNTILQSQFNNRSR